MKISDVKPFRYIDWITVLLVIALFSIGVISIASIMASPFSGTESGFSDYMEKLNLEYVEKQLVNFAIGLVALVFVLVIDYHMFKSITNVAYVGMVFVLLLLVLLGKTSRGVAGWFTLENLNRAIQPAELCKIVLILMFAKIISKGAEETQTKRLSRFRDIALIIGMFIPPTALVCIQPDFGTAFVYICILVCVLFMSGISWKYILPTVILAAIAAPLLYKFVLTGDQKNRILVFLDPELDPAGAGYNVIQSKMSIGSGLLMGKGYFTAGTLAQMKYVPERHTDFIFAGIVEGLGFVGGTIIIVLYFALIIRWLYIAFRADDIYGMCLVSGCVALILAHVFENIGMTMGLMPVTGIPLPFISYGGSNLLTSMIAVGIVLNVYLRRPAGRKLLSRTSKATDLTSAT